MKTIWESFGLLDPVPMCGDGGGAGGMVSLTLSSKSAMPAACPMIQFNSDASYSK